MIGLPVCGTGCGVGRLVMTGLGVTGCFVGGGTVGPNVGRFVGDFDGGKKTLQVVM